MKPNDPLVIFENNDDFGNKDEELYVQEDGSLALVYYTPEPHASVLTAAEAKDYFPEYADRIAAAMEHHFSRPRLDNG